MNRAVELFLKKYPKVRTIVQKPGMKHRETESFINEFINADEKMRVGFCVLGGSFSEGIDLPGKSLIGVVIVGAGVPGISSERNIMRDYYELSRGCGYDYSYTYPGINNILQAAGRVIRNDTDKGIVVLIDDRYSTPKYKEMYPEHWDEMQYFDSSASLNFAITEFWK
jgi:Rad3-related DNA helicase